MTDFWSFLQHYMASNMNRRLRAFEYIEPVLFAEQFEKQYKLGRN